MNYLLRLASIANRRGRTRRIPSAVEPAQKATLSAWAGDKDDVKAATQTSQKYLYRNQREAQLDVVRAKYSSPTKTVDVLIVGGGATGAGAALDAATRNLSTVLIERSDFGNETSSRSTKLIWAGIRYIGTATGELLRLKNLMQPMTALNNFWSEFKMVINCHKERNFLLKTQKAPDTLDAYSSAH